MPASVRADMASRTDLRWSFPRSLAFKAVNWASVMLLMRFLERLRGRLRVIERLIKSKYNKEGVAQRATQGSVVVLSGGTLIHLLSETNRCCFCMTIYQMSKKNIEKMLKILQVIDESCLQSLPPISRLSLPFSLGHQFCMSPAKKTRSGFMDAALATSFCNIVSSSFQFSGFLYL